MDASSDLDSLTSPPDKTDNAMEFDSFDSSNNRILKNDSSYNNNMDVININVL